MSNVLLVPVHLDALVLDQDEVVVEATADFSRLPFYTGKRDINPDIANISEEIVATPFQNRNDRAWQKIESLRIQLFSDWYKYMLCAYPPEDTRDAYPDIDQVATYVDHRRALLDDEITNAGEVTLDETGGVVVARVKSGTASSRAGALVEAINKLQTSLPGPAYRLKQTSGPRYWRPTEPSVLIEGSIAEPSRRHGQDRRTTGGLVPTDFMSGVDNADLAETRLRERFRQRIDGIGASAKNFAFTTWEAQPWNQFLLEWEIEVFPVEHHSNIDPATGRYQEDFIAANYQLVERTSICHSSQGKARGLPQLTFTAVAAS